MMQPLPNLSESRLAEAIARIGRDGFEAALWELFLAVAQPDNLIVLAYRDAGPPLVLYRRFSHPQVFAELESTYVAGAFRLDPYYDLHRLRAPDGAYRLRDIAPDAFHRSRYFIEYYDQTTLTDEISFVVWPAPSVSLNLCLGRDATSARGFGAAEIECCQRLAPVIAALARAHWRGIAESAGPAEDTAAVLARSATAVRSRVADPAGAFDGVDRSAASGIAADGEGVPQTAVRALRNQFAGGAFRVDAAAAEGGVRNAPQGIGGAALIERMADGFGVFLASCPGLFPVSTRAVARGR
jgi:hypothetical protein